MILDTRMSTDSMDNYKIADNGSNLVLELETAQEMLAKGFESEGALMIYSIIIFPLKDLLLQHYQTGQNHYLPRIVYLIDQLYSDKIPKDLNDLSKVILGSYLRTEDGKKYCRNCDEASVNQSKSWHLDQLHRYLLMLQEKIEDFSDNWPSAKYDQGEIAKGACQLHNEILKQSKLFSHNHQEISYAQAYKNLLDPRLIESGHYRAAQGKLDLIEAAQTLSLERLLELSRKLKIFDLLPYIILSALRNDYIKISNQAFTLLAEAVAIDDNFRNKLILDKTRSLLNQPGLLDEYEDQVVLPLISTTKIIIE